MRFVLFWFAVALVAGEPGLITVPLRLDRSEISDGSAAIDFGTAGLPDSQGHTRTGTAPGGMSVSVMRVRDGYSVQTGGLTQTILPGGSVAVEAHGLPFVISNEGRSLRWIPHYHAEGILTVGPCRERIAVFDVDANGRFDDLARAGSVGIDVHHDGRLRFGKSIEFCGRLLSVETFAADGGSITFREISRLTAKVGEPAPLVTLATLDGHDVTTSSHRAKPLLLDFWATWCDICLGEFPAIRKLHESGVEVISINIDQAVVMPSAREVLRREKPAWPQVMTGQGEATSAWQVFGPLSQYGGMPLYVLIDVDGVVRYAGTGGGPGLPEIAAPVVRTGAP